VGGILALAMARRLSEEGESVALVALLDTPFPTARKRVHVLLLRRAPWVENLARRFVYYAGRLGHHARALRALSGYRLAYLSRKVGAGAKGFVSSAGAHRDAGQRRLASYAGHLLASRPASFPGRMGLVESEASRESGFGRAWARHARQVEVVACPGDHETYITAHGDRVAEVLRRWLDEAGGASGPLS
jgi:thioesterase domain-containing protein